MFSESHELASKRICNTCIGDAHLASIANEPSTRGTCDYCGQTGPLLSIEDVADRVEIAFSEHYTRTATGPDSIQERMQADRESSYVWIRDGLPLLEAIQESALIDEKPALDVLEILQDRHSNYDAAAAGEESEFDADSHYSLKGPDNWAWHREWDGFQHSLKTEARFFSQAGGEHLAAVFGGVDALKTSDGRPLVIAAGPQSGLDSLFRARVFQSETELAEAIGRPDIHLGSPPPSAARAGRMNAQGIAVFYGATHPSVAISEVRPPVGSHVAVARFTIRRALRLLDLTAFENVNDKGSVFDPTLKRRLERAAFLRTLGYQMARPIMPNDEALGYLPTQAVADFLATMNEPRLDGIIFPSAQTKEGRNVVLFQHAARVEPLDLPKDAEIEISSGFATEDGWEVHYSVVEEIPLGSGGVAARSKPENRLTAIPPMDYFVPRRWSTDYRQPTLEVDAQSVMVHYVDSVGVATTPYAVDRQRIEKREPKY